MKLALSKKLKISTVGIIFCILISVIFITVFAKPYFSESVFYVNQHKYKLESVHGSIVNYTTGTAPSIEVHNYGQDRSVIINKEEYSIYKRTSTFGNNYEVIYPNEHKYKVENQFGSLMSYDANGEMVLDLSLYIDGYRNILQDGQEQYHPSSLVMAAYSEYHSKQGSPFLFFFSFLLFIYGWSGFRYQKFQNFLFIISLRWIWVNDAEPSDFHYFMCKVGGILTMIGSLLLLINSFSVK